MSIVRLVSIRGRVLKIRDLDIVDGTPLLDLKPYVPEFDQRKANGIGWLSKVVDQARQARADNRFE
jgi:tRNA (Thr-GGU) A37 N-methylase